MAPDFIEKMDCYGDRNAGPGELEEVEAPRAGLICIRTQPGERLRSAMALPRDIKQFSSVLMSSGAPAALAYLNQGVPHRYSAIYRLADEKFENLFLHDKQGEITPEFLAVVPFEISFCQFVLRDGVFTTNDSAADRRLDGHPYQGVMVSYHGVPIAGDDGSLLGTLCHFDVSKHPLAKDEFALLQSAARTLPSYLHRADG